MKNIAEILRAYFKANEPIYSPVCGEVTDWYVKADGDIVMKKCDMTYTFDEYGRMDEFGDCLVFPNKAMRDWGDFKTPPKYRPFKDAEECWNEMMKHQPFGWVKGPFGEYAVIDFIDASGTAHHGKATWDFKKSFDDVVFADGTPFGIKEGGEE